MSAATDRLGTFERRGDYIDVRFERLYRRPVDSVWKSLTEPARLADWMGQSYVEPFVGGRYETMLDGLKPMRGRVRIWEPPTLLEYDWHSDHAPVSVARWELAPAGAGTRVVFEHRGMPYANSNLMLPGWHVYLAHLGAVLDGAPPGSFETAWRGMQDVYARRYALQDLRREP
ncbi:MAG: SRPBCC family protein [Devosia sp.]|uniref:SRPBCC family protein n=1 Tax=Devosia sp. TaxID=1871048 RepID=UPI001A637C58|nr:SRPBCC family protein [Devosia sp.]MBL8598312.1 SRPBCC family protein [Devosia sp.]